MNISLDIGAFTPEKAHPQDAGLDLKSPVQTVIRARNSSVIDTGVHMEIPNGYAGLLVSKSGLNTNHGITSTGLIDSGYTGSIKAKLYNHSDSDYTVNRGDKITQLVLIPIAHFPNKIDDICIVDKLRTESERGDNGFGSSGR